MPFSAHQHKCILPSFHIKLKITATFVSVMRSTHVQKRSHINGRLQSHLTWNGEHVEIKMAAAIFNCKLVSGHLVTHGQSHTFDPSVHTRVFWREMAIQGGSAGCADDTASPRGFALPATECVVVLAADNFAAASDTADDDAEGVPTVVFGTLLKLSAVGCFAAAAFSSDDFSEVNLAIFRKSAVRDGLSPRLFFGDEVADGLTHDGTTEGAFPEADEVLPGSAVLPSLDGFFGDGVEDDFTHEEAELLAALVRSPRLPAADADDAFCSGFDNCVSAAASSF